MKYKIFHTHLNTVKGEEEPLFIAVAGRMCIDCQKKKEKNPVMAETIFKQLFKSAQAVGFDKQQIDQTDQEYLGALISAISTVDAETWNALSDEAQSWYNEAIIFRNIGKPYPEPLSAYCPGYVGREEAAKVMKASPKETPKGLTAQQVFSGQPMPKVGEVPGTERVTAGKRGKKPTTGVTDFTRRIIVSHPDWTVRQVWEYLRLNGFPGAKVDSIAVARGDIRRIMEIMKEIGWKEPALVEEEESKTKVPVLSS